MSCDSEGTGALPFSKAAAAFLKLGRKDCHPQVRRSSATQLCVAPASHNCALITRSANSAAPLPCCCCPSVPGVGRPVSCGHHGHAVAARIQGGVQAHVWHIAACSRQQQQQQQPQSRVEPYDEGQLRAGLPASQHSLSSHTLAFLRAATGRAQAEAEPEQNTGVRQRPVRAAPLPCCLLLFQRCFVQPEPHSHPLAHALHCAVGGAPRTFHGTPHRECPGVWRCPDS